MAMTPQSGPEWTMHAGDCLAGLAALADDSIDVTISDPPYSEHVDHGQAVSGRRSGQAVIRKKQIGNVGHLDSAKVALLCQQLVRVTRRWIVVFCAWEQAYEYANAIGVSGGRYVRTCAWSKPDGTPQLTGDRPATWGECIVVGYGTPTGRLRWNGGGKRGLYTANVCRGAERSEHPTQKPLDLMLELVTDFSNPGEIVIDPFAGSGSTGVACRMLNRKFVGFELDPNYYEIACRRLRGEAARVSDTQCELFAAGGST